MRFIISPDATEKYPVLKPFACVLIEAPVSLEPFTLEKLLAIAQNCMEHYDFVTNLLGDDDKLQEEWEETVANCQCVFITQLCFQLGLCDSDEE